MTYYYYFTSNEILMRIRKIVLVLGFYLIGYTNCFSQLSFALESEVGLSLATESFSIPVVFPNFYFQGTQYFKSFYVKTGVGIGFPRIGIESGNLKTLHRITKIGIPVTVGYGPWFLGTEFNYGIRHKQTASNVFTSEEIVEFSKERANPRFLSVFLGYKFLYSELKFKYYLDNLLNKEYCEFNSNGIKIIPFENIDSKIVYLSLSFDLVRLQ